jgi:UDPglucose 6-dehydrogenase
MEQAKLVLDNVEYCRGPYEAVEGAHAVAILTEWDAFRALDLKRIRDLLQQPILVDLRNIYPRAEVEALGLQYSAIGR